MCSQGLPFVAQSVETCPPARYLQRKTFSRKTFWVVTCQFVSVWAVHHRSRSPTTSFTTSVIRAQHTYILLPSDQCFFLQRSLGPWRAHTTIIVMRIFCSVGAAVLLASASVARWDEIDSGYHFVRGKFVSDEKDEAYAERCRMESSSENSINRNILCIVIGAFPNAHIAV